MALTETENYLILTILRKKIDSRAKFIFVFSLNTFKQYKYTNHLKYFGLFTFEKLVVRENKYVRKLVFDRCAKINERNKSMSNARN